MPAKVDGSSAAAQEDCSIPVQSHGSGETSPTLDSADGNLHSADVPPLLGKKKKKKKPKKSAKTKDAVPAPTAGVDSSDLNGRSPVLCISRNKHWRYISSYHGPWLQLPLELLESLLILNLDPGSLSASDSRLASLPSSSTNLSLHKSRDRAFQRSPEYSPPDSPRTASSPPRNGKTGPPPIDPGVFRSVTTIRRLIDEAAELSVRATSGLSAAALGSIRGGSSGMNGNPWATAQALGMNSLGESGGGRNVAMSATRIHRLRALAVQKLAQAYKADEIASSVMVMQGGSVFDDIAERVLKVDPNDVNAKYVHFFHEKIPSRQLAESTTTQVLDELIAAQPQRLEFYRTRGIVHCFRDEYYQATKDFTFALKEARAARKARALHRNNGPQTESRSKGIKKKNGSRSNGQAPPSGTSVVDNTADGTDGEPPMIHPSVSPDAPDPIEPQLLFLRGAAFLQQVVFLIETAILSLEGVRKSASVDGAELRLCYIENGKYGGVEIGHPDGPLGKKDGTKMQAYRKVLAEERFREQITTLLKKSMRDHEKFLAYFDNTETPNSASDHDFVRRTEHAFLLCESSRPGSHTNGISASDAPTTYHPLLVESLFSILICLLMLADFPTLLPTFPRTAALIDRLDGYPVFLPPRSMAQAEFIEVLERLAGWKNGAQPHSLSQRSHSKAKLQIEAPPSTPKGIAPTDTDAGQASTSRCAIEQDDHGSGSAVLDHQTTAIATSREDLVNSLDCVRILLAPVLNKQKDRAEKAAADKSAGVNKKRPLAINIPLHGPRVEIILAWLAAVHLFELDSVA